MAFSDYGDYDALGLAELVRARQVSAQELLEAALGRVAASNPRLNPVTVHAETLTHQAIAAGLPESSNIGVPLLLEDLGPAPSAGLRGRGP